VRAIWKFPLELRSGEQTVEMPVSARIVHVHNQDDRPCLWADVETTEPTRTRTFGVYATGEELPLDPYVDTVHIGWTVWHVLERNPWW
jgi:hypothetical protein